ncbi:MAG TPA: hypothetical protein VK790_04140 [Solirubrobacteraceae bacterium]|nr:hypothetical protein [Solirubrobacteraceae bacterium]
MTFATAQPLVLKWGQLKHGKSVEVCNGGRAAITRLKVVATDFSFERKGEGKALPTAAVIKTAPPHHPIRPGSCAPVRLSLASELPLESKEYQGSLLLVAAGGGSARLQTTVAVPAPIMPGPAAATEPASVSIHNAEPWSTSGDAVLLLKESSTAEAELSAAAACHGSHRCFIGNLYQGERTVRVEVSGTLKHGEHVLELPIHLDGSSHPVGTYEGSVTLPGVTQSIKVKLSAQDGWWCAVLALLLGVALTAGGQWWNGHGRPKRALLERSRALISQYDVTVATGRARITPKDSNVRAYVKAVEDAIRVYARSVAVLEPKSEAYKQIDEALKLAEADAEVFGGALERALDRLWPEIDSTTALLSKKAVPESPEILRLAAELVNPGELGVGEATQHAKQAEQLAPVLAAWRKLTTRVLTNVVWLKALDGEIDKLTTEAAREGARNTLEEAGLTLSDVRRSLFEATDPAEIAAIRSSAQLSHALGQIAATANKYKVEEPDPEAPLSSVAGDLEAVGYKLRKGAALTVATVKKESVNARVRPARPATMPPSKWWVLVGDSIVLLGSVVASIVAGLSAFYFYKTFGSVEDYLTVIVVGTAAQVVLKAVVNHTEVLLHDISPQTATSAAQVLLPKAPAALALATPPAPPAPS